MRRLPLLGLLLAAVPIRIQRIHAPAAVVCDHESQGKSNDHSADSRAYFDKLAEKHSAKKVTQVISSGTTGTETIASSPYALVWYLRG